MRKTKSISSPIEPIEPQGPLTDAEQQELTDAEQRVALGNAQAAIALKIIHDRKLYRAEFGQWEDYIAQRWGQSIRYSHHFLFFGKVCGLILEKKKCTIGSHLILPTMERQVRPLAKLAEDAQRVVAWSVAMEQAGGKVPSGTQVEQVVAQMMKDEPKPRKRKASAAHPPETAGSAGAGEAERLEDTPETDAESLNVSEEASRQDAQEDSDQPNETADASISDVAPATEIEDDDHFLQPMQKHDTNDDGNAVGETAQDCVAEAEASDEVEEAATASNVPVQQQVSSAPPRRQAAPEKVERANKLAKICRDAVAGQVSEEEAAFIYELLRMRLAEHLA